MAAVIPPSTTWVPHAHSHLHKRNHSSSAAASVSFQPTSELLEKQPERDTDHNSSTAHSIKIKPYLRKLSLRDGPNTIDLSRPSAENEKIAGLGFYDESRSGSDVAFSPAAGSRTRHQRSTSNNSTFSNSSACQQRPTAPYAQPFRHTPRPYTPPIARSYTASSLLGSEGSGEADDIMSDEDFRSRQKAFDPNHRSGSIGSLPTAPLPIHAMHSSSSLTRLNVSNPSLNSLPSMPTSRSRGDTLRSVDTMSSTRTSMDKAMSLIRGTSDPAVDPTARAVAIMNARMAYAQKEEEKERRAEKEYLKQQNRKRPHKEHRHRHTESSSTAPGAAQNEKLEFVGRAYTDYTPAHTRTLPQHVRTPTATPGAAPTSRRSTKSSRSMKARWLGFVAWFKTRLLRMGKKMRGRK